MIHSSPRPVPGRHLDRLVVGVGAVVVEHQARPISAVEQGFHLLDDAAHAGANGRGVGRLANRPPIEIAHVHHRQ